MSTYLLQQQKQKLDLNILNDLTVSYITLILPALLSPFLLPFHSSRSCSWRVTQWRDALPPPTMNCTSSTLLKSSSLTVSLTCWAVCHLLTRCQAPSPDLHSIKVCSVLSCELVNVLFWTFCCVVWRAYQRFACLFGMCLCVHVCVCEFMGVLVCTSAYACSTLSYHPLPHSPIILSSHTACGAKTPLSKLVTLMVVLVALSTLTTTFNYIPQVSTCMCVCMNVQVYVGILCA